MTIPFSSRLKVPDDVLISGLQNESVILNLESEKYFGLDEVGTRMMSLLTTSESIEEAFELLLEEFDVDREVLRQDVISLVDHLVKLRLVEVLSE